jgi:hypothetical protein
MLNMEKKDRALVVLLILTIVPEVPPSNMFCMVLFADGPLDRQWVPRQRMKVNTQVQLDTAPIIRTGS